MHSAVEVKQQIKAKYLSLSNNTIDYLLDILDPDTIIERLDSIQAKQEKPLDDKDVIAFIVNERLVQRDNQQNLQQEVVEQEKIIEQYNAKLDEGFNQFWGIAMHAVGILVFGCFVVAFGYLKGINMKYIVGFLIFTIGIYLLSNILFLYKEPRQTLEEVHKKYGNEE